jgi:tetratricopeptide (TPR) repeat protein
MKRERILFVLQQSAGELSLVYGSSGPVIRGRLLRVGTNVLALGRFIAEGDEAIVHELIDLNSGEREYVAKFCRYAPGSVKYDAWAVPYRVEGNQLSRLADVELNTAQMVQVSGVWIKVQRYFAGTNLIDWGSRRTVLPLLHEISGLSQESALARLEALLANYGPRGLLLETKAAVYAKGDEWEKAETALRDALAIYHLDRSCLSLKALVVLSEVYKELYRLFENPGATKMSLNLGDGRVSTQRIFATPEAAALDDSVQDRTCFTLLEALGEEPLFVPALLALADDLSDHMPEFAIALAKRAKAIDPEVQGIDEFIAELEPATRPPVLPPEMEQTPPPAMPAGVQDHMRRFDAHYAPDANIEKTGRGRQIAFHTLFERGEFDKALATAEEWIALPGGAFDGNLAKLRTLTALGRYSEGEALGQHLLEEFPDQVELADALYWLFDAQGNHNEALRYALIVLNSGDVHVRNGSYLASRSYRKLASYEKAEAYALTAFADNFFDVNYLLNYIYILREMAAHGDGGAWERSDAVLVRALAANTESSEIRFCVAQSLARSGRIGEAIEMLKEVLAINPTHPVAHKFILALEEHQRTGH